VRSLITTTLTTGENFPRVMRWVSLGLASLGVILAFVFVLVLLLAAYRGDGLTFVGLLLTAAGFFANAGRPCSDVG
jgi:hypothetical protein